MFGAYRSDGSDAPSLVQLVVVRPQNYVRVVIHVASIDVRHHLVVSTHQDEPLPLRAPLRRHYSPLLVDSVVGLVHVQVGSLLGVGVVGNLKSSPILRIDNRVVSLVVRHEAPELIGCCVKLPQNQTIFVHGICTAVQTKRWIDCTHDLVPLVRNGNKVLRLSLVLPSKSQS